MDIVSAIFAKKKEILMVPATGLIDFVNPWIIVRSTILAHETGILGYPKAIIGHFSAWVYNLRPIAPSIGILLGVFSIIIQTGIIHGAKKTDFVPSLSKSSHDDYLPCFQRTSYFYDHLFYNKKSLLSILYYQKVVEKIYFQRMPVERVF